MKRFKSILLGMLAIAFIGTIISCSEEAEAASTDWKKSEHNWNIEAGEFSLNVRNQYRADYDHVEVGVKLGEPFKVAIRAAEEDGAREYNPRLTHTVFNWTKEDEAGNKGPLSLSLGHQIEYRYFETDGVDANWRYRSIARVAFNVSDEISLWAKIQPRLEFGEGKEDDLKIDDVKNQVGFQIHLDDVATFSPYVEYIMDSQDKDFERKELFIGTALTFKLN